MPFTKQLHVDLDLQTASRLEALRATSGYGHGFISSFLRRAIKNQLLLEEKNGRAVVNEAVSPSDLKKPRGANGDLSRSEKEADKQDAKRQRALTRLIQANQGSLERGADQGVARVPGPAG